MSKVKLVWDAQFCGRLEEIVEVEEPVTDEKVRAIWCEIMGMEYDENCEWFEVY